MQGGNAQDALGVLQAVPGLGILQAYGITVPADNEAGFATGCLFHHVDGGNNTAAYINEGTNLLCDFNPLTP
jgi:hypothetical protein